MTIKQTKPLTKRQQIVFNFLGEIQENGMIRITNLKLAQELSEKKGMTGFNNHHISPAAMSVFLQKLKSKNLIKIYQGDTTRDRSIEIV